MATSVAFMQVEGVVLLPAIKVDPSKKATARQGFFSILLIQAEVSETHCQTEAVNLL